MWTLPIDDLLRANHDGLMKVYAKYTNIGKKWLELDDCIEIMTPLQISEFTLK